MTRRQTLQDKIQALIHTALGALPNKLNLVSFNTTPPNPQQSSQQQQPQQPQQQTALNTQAGAGGPASTNLPANIDKNIIFANSDRLAQQYNLQNAGQQSQPTFTALHDDPSSTAQAGADANLSQSSDGGNVDPSKGGNTSQTTRVVEYLPRANVQPKIVLLSVPSVKGKIDTSSLSNKRQMNSTSVTVSLQTFVKKIFIFAITSFVSKMK